MAAAARALERQPSSAVTTSARSRSGMWVSVQAARCPFGSGELAFELLELDVLAGQPALLLDQLGVFGAGGVDGVAAAPRGQAASVAGQPRVQLSDTGFDCLEVRGGLVQLRGDLAVAAALIPRRSGEQAGEVVAFGA